MTNNRPTSRPTDRTPAYRGGRGRKAHAPAGAYALDALDPKERLRYERHLARCPGCAQEVRDLAQGAVRLARAVAAPAPPEMRQRVLAAAYATPQEAPSAADGGYGYAGQQARAAHAGRSGPGGRRARGRGLSPSFRRPVLGLRIAAAAGALSLAAAVVLGVELVRTRDALDRERGATRAVEQVLSAPDARGVSARDAQGRGINAVTSRRLGAAVVTVSGLAAPPDGRAYQLWMIDAGPSGASGTPRSAGLLDGNGEGTSLVTGGFGAHTERLAVTLEPDGGSTRPSTNPVVQLALRDP
ncbi:anti-sigma factor domain-containing protein [Streptomyces sp. NPDC021225]|uniref:anti-sigma factor n=1 Tax=Streptomyces sp. NPDC021225 TaxID=3365121 RepID=UPI0037BDBB83